MDPTDADGSLKFVEALVTRHIGIYQRKRGEMRLASTVTKLISILLAGSVTVILGLKEYNGMRERQEILSGIAFCLSAVVSALTAWESFADYNWGWVRYRNTLANLLNLRDDIAFEKHNGTIENRKVAELYDDLKVILHETNNEWLQKRGASITGRHATQPARNR